MLLCAQLKLFQELKVSRTMLGTIQFWNKI